MKKVSLAVGLLFLCSFAAFGQSASGGFRFETEDGTQTVEFSAQTSNGRTTGGLNYQGVMETPEIDVDGDGNRDGGKYPDWQLKVDIDCMVVVDNRASLSGLITDATQKSLVGRRVILAVEDNSREPDRFSWGVYRNDELTWIPQDSEDKEDRGWFLSWMASDAEVKEDVPIPNVRDFTPSDCTSFPLATYELQDLKEGGVQVEK